MQLCTAESTHAPAVRTGCLVSECGHKCFHLEARVVVGLLDRSHERELPDLQVVRAISAIRGD